MISAWWLALVIPVSAFFGLLVASLCYSATRRDEFDDT